jgi:adenylate kinase
VRLVLVGPPGAGKGTQAQFIAEHLHVPNFSQGDIVRENVGQGTELGLLAKSYMDRGDLVPDDVTIDMVRLRLAEPDALHGFLLDGFPRTVPQAQTLDDMLAEAGVKLDVVLELVVEKDEVIRRLSGRRTCRTCNHIWHVEFDPPAEEGICDLDGGELYQRDDDKPEAVRHRLDVYARDTAPIADYYRDHGSLVQIDGNQSADEVRAALDSAMQPVTAG